MKKKVLIFVTAVTLLLFPLVNFAQAPTLGTAANFVLFSSAGAVSNTGISQVTGNVGTNNASSTGFGNVNGQMHDQDLVSGQCAMDLLTVYGQLSAATPTFFPAPLLGNGQSLNAGIYSIAGATTLNLNLTLNGQGDPNALFIFQIQGPLSSGAAANVILINGAQACNVYWKVEGLVSLAAGTTMRGTVIANNAAIDIYSNSTLEGRALSTTGAVTVHDVMAYTPVGCGSPVLNGPAAPALGTTACYTLFSGDGPVSNTGITHVIGDVGTNVGLTTGFNPLYVAGNVHPIPDVSTGACASDLANVYNYLNLLPYDIELLYPALFGRNLVLTPHTYVLNAATILTDSLYLNGVGNADAVFIIKIYGALSTSTYSKVLLINGTQAKNVYWLVSGAVNIMDYSEFKGTIVCNNGAANIATGTTILGRVLLTTGALTTASITANMTEGCGVNPLPVATVTGNTTTCVNSGNFTYVTEPGMTNYTWTVSPGGIINTGAGTNQIQVSWNTTGPQTVTVSYTNLYGFTTLPTVMNINVLPMPVPTITGPAAACEGSTTNNYVTEPGMTGYVWTVSTGGLITAGGTTNAITVTWSTSGPKTVTANYANTNGCVAAVAGSYAVTVNSTPAPTITGATSMCVNSGYYNYMTQPGFTGYTWTISSGGLINYGSGTNQIQVSWIGSGPQWVAVNYNNPSGCTSAPAQMVVDVTPPPSAASSITGTTNVCAGTNEVHFSTAAINGAMTYVWTLPANATISTGMGTNAVTVNFGANAVSGNIFVHGNNLCGNGSSSGAFPVVVSPLPVAAGIITGTAGMCEGTTGVVYSVGPIALATGYNWTVPTGAVIVSGTNTTSITVDFGTAASSGVITVAGTNSCGSGIASPDFNVTVTAIPQAPVITLLGTELTSSATSGNQWYFEGTAIAGATGQTYTALQSGLYWDIVTINGCMSESSIQMNVVMVGVNEADASSQFTIYPIPNNGKFTISMNSPRTQTFSVEVYNMNGNKIYEERDILVLGTISKVIDLRPVSNGVYTVVFMSSENRMIRKVQIDN